MFRHFGCCFAFGSREKSETSECDDRISELPDLKYEDGVSELADLKYDDRISELPDLIIHQILSFLPANEAAKTCILSKRWHHIWETFPILECDQLFFGKYLDLLNPREVGLGKDFRRMIFSQRAKFISSVDERLQRVHEKDVRLKKFGLVMTLVSLEYVPRVDSWIDVVIGSVQELELRLRMGKRRFYALPMKVLASSSLTVLRLKGCTLAHCSGRDDVKLCSLVELHLQDCFIDEDSIKTLTSSIESMEVFSLKGCLGFTKLRIHGHDKLRKLVFHPHKDLKMEAFSTKKLPNLEELEFWCLGKARRQCKIIDSSDCPNLKRLSLTGFPIGAKALQSMISSFRLLEHLVLGGGAVKEMNISISVVKEVHLHNCSKMVKAEFNTPALRVLRFYGKNLPRIFLNNVAASRIAELPALLNEMDSSWFMKLNVFIEENKFQDLIVPITAGPGDQIPFITKDFLRTQVPQPVELKSVRLAMHGYTSMKYGALLDGLFWGLRPKTLSLELNYNSSDFMKGLLKSLVEEANPDCYCSESLRCWRHSLKDIKLGNMKGFQTGTPLDPSTLSSLNDFLDNWAIKAKRVLASNGTVEGEDLCFDMSW